MATAEKKQIQLETILNDSFGQPQVLERKYFFQENGNPRIKNGDPEVKSEKFLDLRAVLISTINHVDRDEQTDLGELVKRGQLINRIRNASNSSITLTPKIISLVKANMVKMKYDPNTIIQVISLIDISSSKDDSED